MKLHSSKVFLTTLIAGSITAAFAQTTINPSNKATVNHPLVSPEKNDNRYIIRFKSTPSDLISTNKFGNQVLNTQKAHQKIQTLGGQVKLNMPNNHAVAAILTPSAKKALEQDENVLIVEKDLPRHLMAQSQPYGISMVQADQVDDSVASAASGGKKICVIDSGLELPHEDMGNQGGTINGSNNSGTGNWHDNGGPHGTHVAGTIAALNNGIGVRGVIGSDASLHIVKVFNAAGWGYSSSLVAAIEECANKGSNVINMSLGGSGSTTTEASAIQSVYDNGVLLIAAAGNDGVATSTTDAKSYPASYDSVVSVAAIDSAKALADFSQKNDQVEIAAPGVDVYSTYPEGTGSVVELTVNGVAYNANGMENQGSISGSIYNFGTGESVNSSASGKVCLIQRGNISFHDKVKNCQDSGGVGAIIYNNAAGAFGGTLGDTNQTTIPGVTVTDTDGAALLNQAGQSASINIGAGNYGKMSGTSMASPHVAGVAALVWSHHPSCSNVEIRNVLNTTSEDLGDAGRDVKFGFGLVQTKAAIDYISANGCDGLGGDNGGGTPPPPSANELENGVAKTGLSGDKSDEIHFTMEVLAGATALSFDMLGGTGDADLYVKFGSKPSTSSYDCRPWKGGNSESCPISSAQPGTYYIMVQGYSAFSGVSLTGSFTEAGSGTQPSTFENTSNIAISDRKTAYSNIDVSGRTGSAGSLDITVDIKHTYIGDLRIDLIAPNGVSARLKDTSNDSTDNLFKTYSVDASSVANANGQWRLKVYDAYRGDTGYVDSWKIDFK